MNTPRIIPARHPSKRGAIARALPHPIPRVLSLQANFAWTLLGNVTYAGCQSGMLIVLAKLGSPELVGQFALALALTAPLFLFTNLQLRAIQATDTTKSYAFGDYLGLRIVATILGLLVLGVITAGAHYERKIALVVLIVGIAKACEAISDIYYGLYQRSERMDRIAISLILRGLGAIAALSIGLYLTGDLLWAVIGLALAWAVVLPLYDIPTGAHLLRTDAADDSDSARPRWVPGKLVRLTWLALPLGLVLMILSLNTNIPRYFIEHYLSTRSLGIFAALSYVMVAGNTVVSALGQAVSPRMARSYVERNVRLFLKLLGVIVGVGIILGVGNVFVALVAGHWVLTLVYGSEYARYTDVFTWLMVAAGLSYLSGFLGTAMTAARYFRVQLPLSIATAMITIGACVVLVPKHGLLGASFAVILATTFQLLGSIAVVLVAVRRNWSAGGRKGEARMPLMGIMRR